jgi:hypothetical protein
MSDVVYSAIGKKIQNFERITDFPFADIKIIKRNTKRLLDIKESNFPPDSILKLEGRNRFSINIVDQAARQSEELKLKSKKERLAAATDAAIQQSKKSLMDEMREILQRYDITKEYTSLFCRLVVAHKLGNCKILFRRQEEQIFVNRRICCPQRKDNDYVWSLREELVFDAIEEILAQENVDPEFYTHLESIVQICSSEGLTSVGKGDALERIIRKSLTLFNGMKVNELPFVKDLLGNLPNWCQI